MGIELGEHSKHLAIMRNTYIIVIALTLALPIIFYVYVKAPLQVMHGNTVHGVGSSGKYSTRQS